MFTALPIFSDLYLDWLHGVLNSTRHWCFISCCCALDPINPQSLSTHHALYQRSAFRKPLRIHLCVDAIDVNVRLLSARKIHSQVGKGSALLTGGRKYLPESTDERWI